MYAEVYNKVLRYSGADEATVLNLGSQLTPDEKMGTEHAADKNFDQSRRLAFADALRDNGREEEADHVSDLTKPIHIHPQGQVEPGVIRYLGRNDFFNPIDLLPRIYWRVHYCVFSRC